MNDEEMTRTKSELDEVQAKLGELAERCKEWRKLSINIEMAFDRIERAIELIQELSDLPHDEKSPIA